MSARPGQRFDIIVFIHCFTLSSVFPFHFTWVTLQHEQVIPELSWWVLIWPYRHCYNAVKIPMQVIASEIRYTSRPKNIELITESCLCFFFSFHGENSSTHAHGFTTPSSLITESVLAMLVPWSVTLLLFKLLIRPMHKLLLWLTNAHKTRQLGLPNSLRDTRVSSTGSHWRWLVCASIGVPAGKNKITSLTTIKSTEGHWNVKRKSKHPLCVRFRNTSCVCVVLFTKKHWGFYEA